MPEPARRRTFSWTSPADAWPADGTLSGLEVLRRAVNGSLPAPPMAELMGMSMVEVQEGRAVFALHPAEWMYNPSGSVHGGVAATLLDSCMGCAVHSTLAAGVGYTTTDLHVRYTRAMRTDTGRVLAEGTAVHVGRRMATAEGRLIVEASGELLAHASTGCIILG
ncbi:MAG: PaaI family thioesterase [Solirubrobacterales bacterium]|nr:PaaI family thioesterase [Solirubrobacterales bacterium]